MTPKVDIIVPVYNAKKYIAKCIRSIQKQTFTDWHLILVDDGSTDGSAEICDRFCAPGGDKRISVVHQENKGVIGARKTGISNASSEFIVFVDADDLLESEMIQRLLEIQAQYLADIVCCGCMNLSRRGWIKRSNPSGCDKVTITSGKEEALRIVSGTGMSTMWGKLYKRAVFLDAWSIHDTLPDIFQGEDNMTNTVIFSHAGKVVLTSEKLYAYRVGGGSSNASEKTAHDLAILYLWTKNYLLNEKVDIRYHTANIANILNWSLYYAHCSKRTISREKFCSNLADVITDIDQFCPNYWHKDAFDLNITMTDKEFKNIYHESPMVVIKQWLLRIF